MRISSYNAAAQMKEYESPVDITGYQLSMGRQLGIPAAHWGVQPACLLPTVYACTSTGTDLSQLKILLKEFYEWSLGISELHYVWRFHCIHCVVSTLSLHFRLNRSAGASHISIAARIIAISVPGRWADNSSTYLNRHCFQTLISIKFSHLQAHYRVRTFTAVWSPQFALCLT